MPHANLSATMLTFVRLLACFSGLFHDVGKRTKHFQNKLARGAVVRDAISHEWISAWILAHMLEHDAIGCDGWEAAWTAWEKEGVRNLLRQHREPTVWRPVTSLDSFQAAALMVVATHHRLFSRDERGSSGRRTPPTAGEVAPVRNHLDRGSVAVAEDVWHRPHSEASPDADSDHWRELFERAREVLDEVRDAPGGSAYWHKAGLIARAAVVLADQHISAVRFSAVVGARAYPKRVAFANTSGRSEKPVLNQPLFWHLGQVGVTAQEYVSYFGAQPLPALPVERREQLRLTTSDTPERFAWQKRSCNFVQAMQATSPQPHAFLIFNVASTGAGKTRANLALLDACRDMDDPLRVTAGFNLKTLSLQTASAYRGELGLDSDECACVIGDPLARLLHQYEEQDDDVAPQQEAFASSGCDSDAFFETLPSWVRKLDRDEESRANATLVGVPVLVATMDYLVACGDPTRQAHHAHALLRIAHSDLLIDEADSYDPDSLVAVLRVIQVAGMFGRNVVVSSATLSAVLAEQIERAWGSGVAMYRADAAALKTHTVLVSNLGDSRVHDMETVPFVEWYRESMATLYRAPAAGGIYRLCEIAPVKSLDALQDVVADSCQQAHLDHGWPVQKGGRVIHVSIGVVRLANVDPLQALAEQFSTRRWPNGYFMKVCTYHSREVAMRRYFKERKFDQLLDRGGGKNLAEDPLVAHEVGLLPDGVDHLLLVVLASPVEEIGRDHDYDWAVIEPSSIHSIIQLAGRVNRHRLVTVTRPNVYVLSQNQRALKGKALWFIRPGLQREAREGGRPTTHLEKDAARLLGPCASGDELSQPFSLDAGFVFDPMRRCHFAEEDDKALGEVLRESACFLSAECQQWACDWIYANYPLRSGEPTTTWCVEVKGNGRLRIKKYQPSHREDPWIEECADAEEGLAPDPAATWLSPSLAEAEDEVFERIGAVCGGQASQVSKMLSLARQFSMHPMGDLVPYVAWTGICTEAVQ